MALTAEEKLEIAERRNRLWRSTAILAAAGTLTLHQVLLSLIIESIYPPSDDDLADMESKVKAIADEWQARARMT